MPHVRLTNKQEVFAKGVLKYDTLIEAHKKAYPNNMKDAQRYVNANELMKNSKIVLRIKELQDAVTKRRVYSLEKSVKRDLELIERYERFLDVLSNEESTDDEIRVAERTMRFIGIKAYQGAQERLAKQHGFFGEHNHQKNPSITPEDRERRIKELQKKLNGKG